MGGTKSFTKVAIRTFYTSHQFFFFGNLKVQKFAKKTHTLVGGFMKQVGVGLVTFWRGILREIRCLPNKYIGKLIFHWKTLNYLLLGLLPMPLARNAPSSRQTNNKTNQPRFLI